MVSVHWLRNLALGLAAVTVAGTRLIDNVPVVLAGGQNTERDFRGAADH